MADQAVKEQPKPVPLGMEPKAEVKTRSIKPAGKDRVTQRLVQAEESTWVQWYERADPRERPWPALVMGKGGDDRNHLLVFRGDTFIQQLWRESVPHMSDPVVTTKKHVQGGQPRGAWDFNPDFVPERYRDLNAIQYRIVLLHQLHSYTALQCAQAIGGGWTEKLAQAVLDQHAQGSRATP